MCRQQGIFLFHRRNDYFSNESINEVIHQKKEEVCVNISDWCICNSKKDILYSVLKLELKIQT